MDLAAVANELYGRDPSQFTAARDARAAKARQEGDATLAAAVKRLRRPSAAAWALNLFVRQRPGEADRLIELGGHLRDAQERLSGEDLRVLGRERRAVVSALSRVAQGLARDGGHAVSPAVGREIEATLEAALADPAAGAAVTSGRLVRALATAGLGPVDLDGAVAGGPATLRTVGVRGSPERGGGRDSAVADPAANAAAEAAAAAEAEAADTQARHAERLAEQARAGAAHAAEAVEASRRRADEAAGALARLQEAVTAAQRAADEAAADADEAQRTADEAEMARRRADEQARSLRARAKALADRR